MVAKLIDIDGFEKLIIILGASPIIKFPVKNRYKYCTAKYELEINEFKPFWLIREFKLTRYDKVQDEYIYIEIIS